MQSASSELKVVSLCSYLTGELAARKIDWPAIKMVKALKGDPINGYFDLTVGGVNRRFNQQNIREYLDCVPQAMAAAILERIDGNATLVPIPNSHVVTPTDPNFSTLSLAHGISAASSGRLKTTAALVFSEPQEKARKGGPRGASHLHAAYKLVADVSGPIVLVDDVWTLAGHLKAACWKLEASHRSVILACTVGRTTHEYVEIPVSVQEHMIDLSRFQGL